ncbi:uncharacterized protein LOC118406227 isoform X2 [Branchiostoma floridae]|uniref:Uncharacterized protein LOC118406227 isoform X2 n=1 Tax=Branchiostoma floridae TaxID=7739 RepID=A0A9J7HM00_BRAFL|nr:uncharacterized protein LOC118406227 isoform X2 [Branchiostoma floridae]
MKSDQHQGQVAPSMHRGAGVPKNMAAVSRNIWVFTTRFVASEDVLHPVWTQSTEMACREADHQYEDVDRKFDGGKDSEHAATPRPLPKRLVMWPLQKEESCLNEDYKLERTSGDGRIEGKMTSNNTRTQCLENEYEDMDPKHVDQTHEDVDFKDGPQGDSSSGQPPKPDMQNHMEKSCSERAAEMWNKAKSGWACWLTILCCVLMVVATVVIAVVLFAYIKPGSKGTHNSPNQDGTKDRVNLANSRVPVSWSFCQKNSSALINLATEISISPLMTVPVEESISNPFLSLPKMKEPTPPSTTVTSTRDCQVGNGVSYRGTVAVTETGRTCQRWDSQYPHDHDYTTADYPSSGLEENYCRNPGGDAGVWCYTTDPSTRWEYCDVHVPVCAQCESGWTESNSYCYKFVSDQVSWYTADSQCIQHGASLATIKGPGENNFIAGLIRKTPDAVWIGLRKSGSVWKWRDGTHFTYSNWKPGEPNNKRVTSKLYHNDGREECVSMYSKQPEPNWLFGRQASTRGKWNDAHCLCDRPYICQKLKQ